MKKVSKWEVKTKGGHAGAENFRVSFKHDYIRFGTDEHYSGFIDDVRTIRKLRNGLTRMLKKKARK